MHMSPLDKVSQLRFDGYTVEMLALEIDLLREGRGTASMTTAVEAVGAVATALGSADETLRTELGKLGVEWQSEASSIAQGVMAASADFAGDATEKINEASQVAFGLSEAFQRALNTLPDSHTLREGTEGLSAMDMLAGLIGHETDHAATVRAASVARDQAVDALNQLASSCGEELAGIRRLSEPGAIVLDHGGEPPPEETDGGSEAGYQTMAAVAESVSGSPEPRPGGTPTAPMTASPPPSGDDRPPSAGANTTTGGRTSDGSRAGSPQSGEGRSDDGGSGLFGGPPGPLTGSSGDGYRTASLTERTGGAPGAGGGAGGTALLGGSGGAAGIAAGMLATRELSGMAQFGQTQTAIAAQGQGGITAMSIADEDGMAGAATAIGAAGIAGAMNAEPDRKRRSKPYGAEDDVVESPRHDFDVGDIEGEAEADAVAAIEPDAQQDAPGYLEHAAPPQDGPADARVRTHGIDDGDLFADDRMVARDTIGDDPNNAYRDDRQDTP